MQDSGWGDVVVQCTGGKDPCGGIVSIRVADTLGCDNLKTA